MMDPAVLATLPGGAISKECVFTTYDMGRLLFAFFELS
jgi:hypothetical protein